MFWRIRMNEYIKEVMIPVSLLAIGMIAQAGIDLSQKPHCYDQIAQQEYFTRRYPEDNERETQVKYVCSSDCYLSRLEKNVEAGLSFPEAHELAKKNCNL